MMLAKSLLELKKTSYNPNNCEEKSLNQELIEIKDDHIFDVFGVSCFPKWIKDQYFGTPNVNSAYLIEGFRDTTHSNELVSYGCFTVNNSNTGYLDTADAMLCLNQLILTTLADFSYKYDEHSFRNLLDVNLINRLKVNIKTEPLIHSVTMRYSEKLDCKNILLRLRINKIEGFDGSVIFTGEYIFSDKHHTFFNPPAFRGEVEFHIG
ncbi:hypothetical protein J1782_00935 [Rahnella sp. BCC 1045]|uniref:hypothetical protein n=1 Tax=Rahnella sp. BCC 1045 TaxID=2816251 RepID=UPI001C265E5C|nr:hypothetical protein [Rahnella sp. BCC 1045]MBU9818456.1 hypothetical protein [Rahnella sp. BCC 1045]